MSISRRDFLKGTAPGAVSIAAMPRMTVQILIRSVLRRTVGRRASASAVKKTASGERKTPPAGGKPIFDRFRLWNAPRPLKRSRRPPRNTAVRRHTPTAAGRFSAADRGAPHARSCAFRRYFFL